MAMGGHRARRAGWPALPSAFDPRAWIGAFAPFVALYGPLPVPARRA